MFMVNIATTSMNKMDVHITYNTGDQVWYKEVDGEKVVTKIIAHDGVTWETGTTFSGKQNGLQRGELFMIGGLTKAT